MIITVKNNDCINVGICIFANRMCITHTETRCVSPTINIIKGDKNNEKNYSFINGNYYCL